MTEIAGLGDEIPALIHLLTCNLDEALRAETERRLTDALHTKANIRIIADDAQTRIHAVRVLCPSCAYCGARCAVCPIESAAQRIVTDAQKRIQELVRYQRHHA